MTTLEAQSAAARDDHELLRDYLRGRSVPCPNCRYDLRDLTGRACPECGEALLLCVGLVEPKLRSFLVGLIALAANMGFWGLGLAFLVIGTLAFSDAPPVKVWAMVMVNFAVGGALCAIWMRARPWIRQRTTRIRRLLTLAACALPVASLVELLMAVSYF